ncbi:MAG: helix-turn-helix domain-containing protein [Candidatus Brocadia sp.]
MYTKKYYEFIRISKDRYEARLELVEAALEQGIKPTAKKYGTTVKTVRKWVRRYKEQKKAGLSELSRRPHTSPGATKPWVRFKLMQEAERLKQAGKRKSASRLKRDLELPVSLPTVLKILREEGLWRGTRKVVEKKRDLREVKQRLKALEKLQVDVKYLDDIPELYQEYRQYRLPKYQFTARCVRTGALFIAYGREKSVTNASLFLLALYRHFQSYGIRLDGSVVQTDNGTEFTAPWNSHKVTIFTKIVERCWHATHHRIPPGAKTFQSDVESSHRWIEEELYASETFSSHTEFLIKAAAYQKWFNCTRHNSYKGDTPLHLIRQTYPDLPAEALVFPPVVLDNLLVQYKDELAQWAA